MNNIWIFAEQTGGVLHPAYFELLGKARSIYPDAVLTAVLLSDGSGDALEALKASGANTVLHAKHETLAAYQPEQYALALAALARQYAPDAIFAAATPVGSELAPTVAAKLETGLAAHCTDLCAGEDGSLITLIPAFGGKLLGEILIPEKRPAMATVKPGVFPVSELPAVQDVAVIEADASFLDGFSGRITLLGVEEESSEQGKLEDAELVICAGLGIATQENWDKLNELSALIQGVVGYTRPVVDMGYVDHERALIGTSGKTIHPKVYLGFGVSGATHHVCGMKDSGLVISVNTDEKAAIFDVSDYKLIGDSGAVLDELLRLLKN